MVEHSVLMWVEPKVVETAETLAGRSVALTVVMLADLWAAWSVLKKAARLVVMWAGSKVGKWAVQTVGS
jgi:hypothetical protein